VRNLKVASVLSLALWCGASLVACTSGGRAPEPGSDGSVPAVASVSPQASATPADPLEGEWHQTFTCEENVRTFQRNMSELKLRERQALAKLKGNNDTSIRTLLLEYTREFAWGPNAAGPIHGELTANEISPQIICEGAPTRERVLRFLQGSLVVQESDDSTEGPAAYEFKDDHTITVNDGGVNFGCCPVRPIDTFSFRIDGERLTITMIGQDDPWGGTSLEEAPWHRVT
jgi:hypothetical protein